MIIDADTHISPIDEPNALRAEELINQMDKSSVDKAICWLLPPYMREINDSLKYIYESVRKYPNRLLGFGWVDPHFGISKGKDTIRKCLNEYGFYGVKLNGAQNSFPIDDEKISMPLIEEIAKSKKILAFHIGADAYDFTHPFRAAKIAKLFPELQILIIHMGGVSLPEISPACIEFAGECKNMHLIGSAVRYTSIVKAIKILGSSRVSFGSDTPFSIMHSDVSAYNAFLSDYFSEEDRKLVMGGNIMRIFKLS
ncbi:MAG: amidohydrolase [Treponema sp.]|nr:amidohydrolase [Treponema sp.]